MLTFDLLIYPGLLRVQAVPKEGKWTGRVLYHVSVGDCKQVVPEDSEC